MSMALIEHCFRAPLPLLPKQANRLTAMSLVEKVRTFVRFLKTNDKDYGEDILRLLESSPIRESDEYGFMLWQSGLFVYLMAEHHKKLNELDTRTSKLLMRAQQETASQ